tara:strand:+ start:27662 stop:28027 length:366 start_codon:yes stop_codon:yes gene_type:complete
MENFNIKDIIYFGGVLAGLIAWFFRDKIKNAEQELKITNLTTRIDDVNKNKLIIKSEIIKQIEANMIICNQRIDRFKDEFSNYKESMNDTLKNIHDLHTDLDKKVDVGFATILSEIKSLKK